MIEDFFQNGQVDYYGPANRAVAKRDGLFARRSASMIPSTRRAKVNAERARSVNYAVAARAAVPKSTLAHIKFAKATTARPSPVPERSFRAHLGMDMPAAMVRQPDEPNGRHFVVQPQLPTRTTVGFSNFISTVPSANANLTSVFDGSHVQPGVLAFPARLENAPDDHGEPFLLRASAVAPPIGCTWC